MTSFVIKTFTGEEKKAVFNIANHLLSIKADKYAKGKSIFRGYAYDQNAIKRDTNGCCFITEGKVYTTRVGDKLLQLVELLKVSNTVHMTPDMCGAYNRTLEGYIGGKT